MLALMLSLSRKLDQDLSGSFYVRIQRIALLAILDMVAAITLMLLLSAPIQETSREAGQAGDLLIGLTAVVACSFVAVIVMLYNAIQAVIQAVFQAVVPEQFP